MKIFKLPFFIFMLFLCPFVKAQDVYLSFANSEITIVGLDTFFEVDVMIASSSVNQEFKLSSGQLYFDYGESFNLGIVNAGDVEVIYDSSDYLLGAQDAYGGLINVYSSVNLNDNTFSRFSVAWQQNIAAACIDELVTEEPQALFRMKLKYALGMITNDDVICFTQDIMFTDQIYTACGPYGSCTNYTFANCSGESGLQITNDNFSCVTTNACAIFEVSPISKSSAETCTKSNDTWTHVIDESGEAILSYQQRNNDLGTVSANVYVSPQPIVYNGTAYSPRHYRLSSSNPLNNGPVNVRLYIKPDEMAALMTTAANTPNQGDNFSFLSDLGLTQYEGPTEDGILDLSDATAINLHSPVGDGDLFKAHYLDFSLSSLSEFWLTSSLRWLPIELIAFTGELEGRNVALTWVTDNEINSDFFQVERSTDASRFHAIGELAAAGESSSPLKYQYLDKDPAAGVNYYRLKMVDRDGTYAYSSVVTVRTSQFGIVSLLPNPVENKGLEVQLANPSSDVIRIQVLDNLGRKVYEASVSVGENRAKFLLPTAKLSGGAYFLRLTDGEYFAIQKFVKVN